MNKTYLLYTLRNQDKKFKPRKFSKAIIISYFELLDWPETDLSLIIPNFLIKFNKQDYQNPEFWHLLINYSELSNLEMDFYFILPMEKEFLFKNIDAEKWVFLHSKLEQKKKGDFSKEYTKFYNEIISYIDLKEFKDKKNIYPDYISRIIERI